MIPCQQPLPARRGQLRLLLDHPIQSHLTCVLPDHHAHAECFIRDHPIDATVSSTACSNVIGCIGWQNHLCVRSHLHSIDVVLWLSRWLIFNGHYFLHIMGYSGFD
jgi:hypothetical protein